MPSSPGLITSKIDHRSPRRFSTGVPVSAMRARADSALAARVCRAAGFLIACASSKIASRQAIGTEHRDAQQAAVAGDHEVELCSVVRGDLTDFVGCLGRGVDDPRPQVGR